MGRKKKGSDIPDDEYSIGAEVTEEPKVEEEKASVAGKKKGKKGNNKGDQPKDDDDDIKVPVTADDDEDQVPAIPKGGKMKGKSKKSGGSSVFSASNFGLLGDEDNGEEESGLTRDEDSEEEDEPDYSFTGKKKSKKKSGKSGGSLFTASAFDAIDDEDEHAEVVNDSVEDEGEDVPVFTGKKKSSKGSKKGGKAIASSSFGVLDEGDEDREEDEDDAEISLSGKKKSSKAGKKGNNNGAKASGFDSLDEGEEENKEDDEYDAQITFSGKKKSSKSSKKSGNLFSAAAALLDEENDEDATVSEPEKAGNEDALSISFSGKKKSSKKKSSTSAFTALNNELDVGPETSGTVEPEQSNEVSKPKEAAETSKNKKKKKNKSGRTAQEEEDLDKILAELGEAPPVVKPAPAPAPPPQEEKVETQPEPVGQAAGGEKAAEEETAESAAAKKKKKKKEKEKEKKAAAAAAAAVEQKDEKPEETKAKGKAADKKVPKHVREMQEALARRKEAEERKKREEEEKLRKEEEERRRQEELERQAEEARRRKKEREKEKLLKKKQEGKLLTGKQKEEARRLEAMRKQFLENAGTPLLTEDKETDKPKKKKPIYGTKKTKAAQNQVNGPGSSKVAESEETEDRHLDDVAEAATSEPDKVETEAVIEEEKPEVSNVVVENGMEEDGDDEDWDAKSWDDVNLNVKFGDEEVESEQEAKMKEARVAVPSAAPAAPTKPKAPAADTKSIPLKSNEVDKKNSQHVGEGADKNKKKDAVAKKKAAGSNAEPNKNEEHLRSPICCIMGHVDTGKTKLLDCIRGTNVQEGEAGGITQQIGATYFPAHNIRERTKELKADAKLKVPGLLVIDTPGHESFTNLRSRGSGLCDIAILVVDIMHGLEPQTIESLNLLKMRNTEFIVALNKVDRLYGWKTCRNAPIVKAMKQQSKDVQNEFNTRLIGIITQFKEQGLNTELYYKNKEMGETFSIVPTSAISGEGIPDLLLLLVQWTQKTMVEKLTFSNEIQCTVLEVKVIEGHGTTIDVVLVNGVLHEGDQIVVCGLQGPIVTTIRALLTPHPMKELRVKGTYLHHKEIKAAQGIKITAQGLEHAIAGTGLYVVGPNDDVEDIKEAAMEDMKSVMSRIDKSGEGVYVQASTLGSLEALLEFLKSPAVKIPVSGIGIGPVHKKDVMKASVMLEKNKEFATILAFDVKVTPEARELADELGVKIFIADIIYHLFDQFKAYIDNLKEEKKKEAADEAVFPCVLKILPNCVFNKKDPIVLGVDVLEGILKVGTPICVPTRDFIDIGRIASIENNHKPVDFAKKGQKVAIKIVGSNSEEQQKMFGRHFEIDDELVSHISRKSIDILKANYRDDLSMEDWKLLVKLKNLFKIQ